VLVRREKQTFHGKPQASELTGWRRFIHLKLRFGLSKLPLFPVRYRLRTPGQPDTFFYWTRVMPFMDPVKGAFTFDLWGWDVRELRFLRRFLAPSMGFIDIGAHYGLYAILASQCVGRRGYVLAFEPARPIFRRLRWHLRLNGARQVKVHACAVGARKSTMTLYMPARGVDTISSLRAPVIGDGITRRIDVEVVALDDLESLRRLPSIDMIKLDVEGAEAEVLEGATRVLKQHQPFWLFEALDATTAAWGSCARDLAERFVALGHELFEFTPDGSLRPHRVRATYPLDSNCNLLAVPHKKLSQVAPFLAAADIPG
jgi:FkbM family methyltransferase